MLFRLAVPFFFISSGYFFSKNESRVQKQKSIKRLFISYLIWTPIYILATFLKDNLDSKYLIEQLIRSLLLSPGSIMWFTGSLIFSMIVVSLLKKNKKYLLISILIFFLLYLFGLSFTTYNFLFEDTFFLNKLKTIFYSNRNPLFSGYLYFAIGYYIGLYYNHLKFTKKSLMIYIPMSLLLLYLESRIIYFNLDKLIEYDFLIMHIPVIIILFIFVKNISINLNTFRLRKMSTIMYYIHFLILYSYQSLIQSNYLSLNLQSKKLDLLVLATTILISYIFTLNLRNRKEV